MAQPTAMHFGTEATLGGSIQAKNVHWALIMMDHPGTTTAVDRAAGLDLQEIAAYTTGESRVGTSRYGGVHWEGDPSQLPPPPESFGLESSGPSSVYAEGALNLHLDSVQAVIDLPVGTCLNWFVQAKDENLTTRSEKLCPNSWPAVVVQLQANSSVDLQGHNVHRLQWHGMAVSCATDSCPPGGDREVVEAPLPPPNYERVRKYLFEEGVNGNGTLHTAGAASYVVFGGSLMDIGLRGWMRLPLASGQAACSACAAPRNQTFFASGSLFLGSLAVDNQGGLQAQVDGDYAQVRFDEAVVDPKLLAPVLEGAAVVATAVAAVVVAKLAFSALFTRRADSEILGHERRRRLFELVEQNPGIHLREALRLAGIPSGSGRFHVTQLVRHGLLTERRMGSNVRLFVSSAAASSPQWKNEAGLRNARFKPILEWLSKHPNASQKDVLLALQVSLGWSPSTTQDRLARLVSDGTVQCSRTGRFTQYRLAHPLAHGGAPVAAQTHEAVQTAV
jgi:predicted transcriptional regulator